ncbi:23538_t:CDS:2, partial [Gigaspora margarita]
HDPTKDATQDNLCIKTATTSTRVSLVLLYLDIVSAKGAIQSNLHVKATMSLHQ